MLPANQGYDLRSAGDIGEITDPGCSLWCYAEAASRLKLVELPAHGLAGARIACHGGGTALPALIEQRNVTVTGIL